MIASAAEVELPIAAKKLSDIWLRMARNISYDFLEFFIVTSQAGGREQSEMHPFGAGKSTFAIRLAYHCWAYFKGYIKFYRHRPEGAPYKVDKASDAERLQIFEDVVRNYVKWHIDDVLKTVKEATFPLPAVVWDDVQQSAPAYQHIPPSLKEKLEKLTVLRPKLKNLIMTAPSISDIARTLRKNITAEIIIPKRGMYEVQFIEKMRDFKNPVDDASRLKYDTTGFFEKLPDTIDALYQQLRIQAI